MCSFVDSSINFFNLLYSDGLLLLGHLSLERTQYFSTNVRLGHMGNMSSLAVINWRDFKKVDSLFSVYVLSNLFSVFFFERFISTSWCNHSHGSIGKRNSVEARYKGTVIQGPWKLHLNHGNCASIDGFRTSDSCFWIKFLYVFEPVLHKCFEFVKRNFWNVNFSVGQRNLTFKVLAND